MSQARENTPTEENMAKGIVKKLDARRTRLAFMSEIVRIRDDVKERFKEVIGLLQPSAPGGRVTDRRRAVGQDADLERVLQEVRCSSARGQRENPSGDSPVKSTKVLQMST
ncbi:hypothetical protein T10_11521 [Trichinella papuae]|uniref:Uncharacterized protein n=1 Tax=Trichinella papuae TaxID=268474 RepID=A0A0V1N319_9BILA|nr:hypothetical protein T10_11521 [Trichinella papuae]